MSAVSELSLRRDPIRLVLSRGLWRSVWYLLGYLAVGWALFAIALSTAVAGAGLSTTQSSWSANDRPESVVLRRFLGR